MGNSGCFPRGKPAATESRTVYAGCFSVSIIRWTLTWTTGSLTCAQMCVFTRGCTDTRKRVCTESWLWEKNPLPHRWIEPASAAWRSDALTNWATAPPGTGPVFTITHADCGERRSVCRIPPLVVAVSFSFHWIRHQWRRHRTPGCKGHLSPCTCQSHAGWRDLSGSGRWRGPCHWLATYPLLASGCELEWNPHLPQ